MDLSERAKLLLEAYENGFFDEDVIFSEGPEAVLAAMHEYEQEEQKNEMS